MEVKADDMKPPIPAGERGRGQAVREGRSFDYLTVITCQHSVTSTVNRKINKEANKEKKKKKKGRGLLDEEALQLKAESARAAMQARKP